MREERERLKGALRPIYPKLRGLFLELVAVVPLLCRYGGDDTGRTRNMPACGSMECSLLRQWTPLPRNVAVPGNDHRLNVRQKRSERHHEATTLPPPLLFTLSRSPPMFGIAPAGFQLVPPCRQP